MLCTFDSVSANNTDKIRETRLETMLIIELVLAKVYFSFVIFTLVEKD